MTGSNTINLTAWTWVRAGGTLAEFDQDLQRIREAIRTEAQRVADLDRATLEMKAARVAFLKTEPGYGIGDSKGWAR